MRLVDADELLKEIDDELEILRGIDDEDVSGEISTMRFARAIVDTSETIEAEPVRHGRWIEEVPYRNEDGYLCYEYRCSLCGRVEDEKEPYCNCGAKMDLEDKP